MNLFCATFIIVLLSVSARGQGTTFIYDQQSAVEGSTNISFMPIQINQPMGQTFTPTFSSLNFVRLRPGDRNPGNSLGATLFLNVRSGFYAGPIIGSSAAVSMPDAFTGYTDFYFSTPVSLTSGSTYFIQPIIQSGDTSWGVGHHDLPYVGGTEYLQGGPNGGFNLWFREGLAVPEPSAAWLAFFGLGMVVFLRRVKIGSQPS